MTVSILETTHGVLYVSARPGGSGASYLNFSITNAPLCFWDAIKELNDALVRARVSGHQILINQGAFQAMHAAHVQVRLKSAADLEKLMFAQPEGGGGAWADDVN